jgi:hypothetical protein
MAGMFQDAKDDLEATKFALGSGTNEPFGVMTGATTVLTTAGTATYALADLYASSRRSGRGSARVPRSGEPRVLQRHARIRHLRRCGDLGAEPAGARSPTAGRPTPV